MSGDEPGGDRADRDRARRPPADAQGRDGPVGDPDAPSPGRAVPRPGAAQERTGGDTVSYPHGRGGSPRRGRREGEEAPRRVGGLIGALFEKLGIADRIERAAAAARWDEVVGREIARRTGDVRVSGRTLFVEVESSAWMQELDMQRHHILRRINEGIEHGQLEKIVFVQQDGRPGRGARGGDAHERGSNPGKGRE